MTRSIRGPASTEPSAPASDRTPFRPDAATFHDWRWRAGDALVGVLARIGVGPVALLTTTGRRTGIERTVPVVPVQHAGGLWLVAPYGPTGWVHNARAGDTVTLRRGRRRRSFTLREVSPLEAAPVLQRYLALAPRARRAFAASPGDDPAALVAEAAAHPVFQLREVPTA